MLVTHLGLEEDGGGADARTQLLHSESICGLSIQIRSVLVLFCPSAEEA
jgi:hypothetical protein